MTSLAQVMTRAGLLRAEVSDLKNPKQWLTDRFATQSDAGIPVNQETALNFSSVYRAVTVIGWGLSMCTIGLYQKRNGNRAKVEDHPGLWVVKNRAKPWQSAFSFRSMMDITALLWGNSYARIIRDFRFRPTQLVFYHPTRVKIRDIDGEPHYYFNDPSKGEPIVEPWTNVLHFHEPVVNGYYGLSPITAARNTIGLGMAAEKLQSTAFKQGAFLSGSLTLPPGETLGDTIEDAENQIAIYRKSFNSVYGGDKGYGGIAILEDGMKIEALSMPLKDAELLLTRKFQNLEVARWYGLPPHKLMDMDGAKFNNIEHLAIEYVQDAIAPRAMQREQELTLKLTTSAELASGHYFKINTDSLIRADIKARYEAYSIALGSKSPGWSSVQEVRALEDKDMADTSDLWVPQNMKPQNQTDE